MKKIVSTFLVVCAVLIPKQSISIEKGKWSFVKDEDWCYIGSSPLKSDLPETKKRGENYILVYKIIGSEENIIQIDNLNDASVVQNQTVTTDEDTIIAITLEGADLENDPMQFYIASTPNLGTLYQTEDGQTITSIIVPGDLVINSQNIVLYEPFENGYGEVYAVFNYYINE